MTSFRTRPVAVLVAFTVGLGVAVGIPLGERWRACPAPTSEACVWDKALFPVSLAVGAVLGAAAALLVFLAVRTWQRRPPHPDAG